MSEVYRARVCSGQDRSYPRARNHVSPPTAAVGTIAAGLAQSQTSTEGEVIAGRYRVEHLLGRGGMGAVYKVCDLSTGELLALKRLNPEASAVLGELLEREYCTLARLCHPRIVQVFEFGIDRGSPFYTMELLSGADLSHQAPMEWRKACTALRDAASTLGVLHARQLVHRDLNPRNLWQTPDGRLKLLDSAR